MTPHPHAPRRKILMVAPSSVHPGGITAVLDEWRAGGLAEQLDVDVLELSAWDDPVWRQVVGAAGGYVRLVRKLARASIRPEVVHLHVSSGGSMYRKLIAGVITRAFGVPYLVHIHSGGFEQWAMSSRIHRGFARRLLAGAAAVLVLADRWRRMADRLGARRTIVLHNTLRKARWREFASVGGARRQERPRAGSPVLLYYGRWSSTKGMDILATALRRLGRHCSTPFEMRIFGNGDRDWMLREFDGMNGTMRMDGWLEDHRKPHELGDADVFVYPSRVEGFGQTLLEVMAAEVPIVASDVGGIPEVLEGYPQARLVPADSPDDLAKALQDAVEGRWPPPDQPTTTKDTERFLTERAITRLMHTYDEIVSEST
jgi:glycosyltransferase involved in cell wall biosynthesis